MSGRLAEYKRTGAGTVQSNKATRREERAREAKIKRNDKFMGRRREVFSEINDIQTKERPEQGRTPPKTKSKPINKKTERNEQLLKWKETREAKKAEEKSKKRPPFVCGRFVLGENTTAPPPQTKKNSKKAKLLTRSRNTKKTRRSTGLLLNTSLQQTSPKTCNAAVPTEPEPPIEMEVDETVSAQTLEPPTCSSGGEKELANTSLSPPPVQTTRPFTIDMAPTSLSYPAWVPGATLPTPKVSKKFDDVFSANDFSPFAFTAGGRSKAESVKGPVAFPVRSVEIVRRSSLEKDVETSFVDEERMGRSDDSIEEINHSIMHNHEKTNTLNDQHLKENEGVRGGSDSVVQQLETEDEALPPSMQSDPPFSEFGLFRKLHDDVVKKFTDLSNEWERKRSDLQESEQANEDVYGQIDSTVGQARLLMRSKLKQYIGLVEKAEDPSQALPTTAEDLQGFWDMMSIQISAIEDQFNNLRTMEGNDWRLQSIECDPIKQKKRTATNKKKRSSQGSHKKTPSDKLKADRAKRAEQRRLLREKMMAGKKNKTSDFSVGPVSDSTTEALSNETSEKIRDETNAGEEVDKDLDCRASEFNSFRKLHDDVVEKFTGLSDEWERKRNDLQDSGQANEEVYGQIDSTVGQARLLMRSKLKQYIGLVEKAEDPSQPLPTTAEDLQGFWDMMSLQISAIEDQFNNLQTMEGNDWEEETDCQEGRMSKRKSASGRKKKMKKAVRETKKTPSEKLKAMRAKRDEQRQLLRERMKAGKNKRSTDDNPDVVTMPLPIVSTSATPPSSGSGLTPPPHKESSSDSKRSPPLVNNLISFTPGKTRSEKRKSFFLMKEVSSSDSDSGGSVTKLVQINASKRLIKELGSEMIMSPARRSLRIHRKSMMSGGSGIGMDSTASSSSLSDHIDAKLPQDAVFRPNKSITDF